MLLRLLLPPWGAHHLLGLIPLARSAACLVPVCVCAAGLHLLVQQEGQKPRGPREICAERTPRTTLRPQAQVSVQASAPPAAGRAAWSTPVAGAGVQGAGRCGDWWSTQLAKRHPECLAWQHMLVPATERVAGASGVPEAGGPGCLCPGPAKQQAAQSSTVLPQVRHSPALCCHR